MPLVFTDETAKCPHCGAALPDSQHCSYTDPNYRDGYEEICFECGGNMVIVSKINAVFDVTKA